MKKVLNYDTLGWALKSLSDACFKAAEVLTLWEIP